MNSGLTVTLRPYKYISHSLRTKNIMIFCFLLPQIFMLFATESWNSLFVILSCVCASVGAEVLGALRNKKSFNFYISSVLQGLFIGFFLPGTFPVAAAFFISFLTIFISRFFLGNAFDCWVNVSALSVCLCWILGTEFFPSFMIDTEILLARNPSAALISNGTFPVNAVDSRITSFLNKTVFSLFSVSVPDGYVTLFWDSRSVIPAFRFNFLTLVTSVVLISAGVIKPLIPALFSLVYGALVFAAAPVFYSGTAGNGDLLLAFMTSGVLFSAFFMLQSDGTVPLSYAGKTVYALLAGVFAFLIIGPGTSSCGAAWTVLLMNVVSPLIQFVEKRFEMFMVINSLLKKEKLIEEGKDA